MEFIQRSLAKASRVGILSGSFNPPTVAHLELLSAAGPHVDEVVCVLPRVFPHKHYFGATLEQRLELLRVANSQVPYSIATTDRGLFVDIAQECRAHYDASTKLYFLCGADAAERILTWDYGQAGYAREMLEAFELLVAPRGSQYVPPGEFQDRVHPLELRGDHHHVSSTEVRERIRRNEPWEHLVPEPIVEQVREIYPREIYS